MVDFTSFDANRITVAISTYNFGFIENFENYVCLKEGFKKNELLNSLINYSKFQGLIMTKENHSTMVCRIHIGTTVTYLISTIRLFGWDSH
jgi:hypothetical protein